ncbi:MAG: hypothetical protein LBD12_03040 [Clostridiales Family XIII bacterium]|jgi:predicted metalloprotease|nr:hypothetical protein [Clostridiales Family XIII bacterium]
MPLDRRRSKKGSFGTSMGVASIIAILVILVLIVFSALSVMTSKADLTLSQKTAAATSAFYEADCAAEERVAEVAALVASGAGWQAVLREKGYNIKEKVVSFDVPIDANRSLFVSLRVGAGGKVVRELWQVRSTSEWEPDEGLDLAIG